jgi:hypothetical protein
MRDKNRCRIVKRLIQSLPKGGCEETLRQIGDHLSGCEACRRVHAEVQKMDEVLIPSATRFEEAARRSESGKSRILSDIAESRQAEGIGRPRLAWVGLAAGILAAASVAMVYWLRGEEEQPQKHSLLSVPRVTRAVAAAARPEALENLVAYGAHLRRPPSFELPYTPPTIPPRALFPQLRVESALQSEEIVRMIVQPRTISVQSQAFPTRREEK